MLTHVHTILYMKKLNDVGTFHRNSQKNFLISFTHFAHVSKRKIPPHF